MLNDKLNKQLDFLYEIDKLKTIYRKTNLIADPERFENSSEHSWHLAFYVLILAEYANEEIDVARVMKMVLLHDIVEIDAGDTFCYDVAGNLEKEAKEIKAAERIFGLLPDDQGNDLKALWQEFEANETADANFANSVDRIHPLLNNHKTGGGSWKRHKIKREQVEERMAPTKKGSKLLAELSDKVIDSAVDQGQLIG